MTTVRDDVLPDLDQARALIASLGLRRYTVTIRVRTWSGGRVGSGTPSDSDLILTPTPRVRVISVQEIASSGGLYQRGDFRVDKITPAYSTPTSGGYTPAQLHPVSAQGQEVVVLLGGDEGVISCNQVSVRFDRAFGYVMIARTRKDSVVR